MEKIELKDKLSFNTEDLTAPNIVIENIVSQINGETDGMVFGSVEEYEGAVESYVSPSVLNSTFVRIGTKVDIQESLGKIGDEVHKYEFFLNTPVYEQYQYRVCFIEYGTANYPVKVIVEQSIADEINKSGYNSKYVYLCRNRSELENNRSELEKLIISVIYSQKVIGVIQELINIYQIHKDKKDIV